MLDLTEKEKISIINIDKAKNIHRLSKLTNTTYAHQSRVISKLELMGIIYTKVNGRERNIDLTDKGKELKWHIEQMILI